MISIILALVISETWYYIICGILAFAVLVGIYLMSKVKTAAAGNFISALSIALGIVVTLIKNNILPVWILYLGIGIGFFVGYFLAVKVKMIEMPELVALLNGVGGAASAIVGFFAFLGIGSPTDPFAKVTALLAVAIGVVTFTGSMIAAAKLHKLMSSRPFILPHHSFITIFLVIIMTGTIILGILGIREFNPLYAGIILVAASAVFGLAFTVRVGGADMPITISLLNSLSGVAGAIAGLAIGDILLVAVGAIVGASGLLLTQIMCRAMNRKLLAILLGKTTVAGKPILKKETSASKEEQTFQTLPADVIRAARNVIIVPGYGMALAQAQHLVKDLADWFRENGAAVKYAIHPVAGRMPGHMNVLLCEADVDYEDLYEMDAINDEFKNTDLTVVIGANDVVNPAARKIPDTPLSGLPILNVDEAPNIIIFNYDLNPGYAGVENLLYKKKEGVYLVLGDASRTLSRTLEELAEATPAVAKQPKFPVDVIRAARNVIIVPGYGMALAQAQHLVKDLADWFQENGAAVKYAIHPVAGRMPGHMNVLLCEADVDYEDLYEMDAINDEFKNADLAVVIGANDVVNPAAREILDTPLSGMPILNVDEAPNIIIFNYDLNPGYAGVENLLYKKKEGVYLVLGDASRTLSELLELIKNT